ncbi:MAG: autotransporter domain-containing protein [Pseudomonadota bacterium]
MTTLKRATSVFSQRIAVAILVLGLCLAFAAWSTTSTLAEGFTIQSDQTVTAQQNIAVGETGAVQRGGTIDNSGAVGGDDGIQGGNNVTVNNAGIVIGADDAIQVGGASVVNNSGKLLGDFGVFNTGSGNVITNSGTISANFVGILDGSNHTITNSGTINTTGFFGFGIAVIDNNTVTNTGAIVTTGDVSTAIGVFDGNTITNSGTISTTGDDSNAIDGDDSNTIVNNGTVTTTGDRSDGLNANDGNTVINTGTVTVSGALSDAVDVDNNTTVINSGVLRSVNDNAIEFDGTGNELVLLPGSVIVGGLEVDFVANTLTVMTGTSLVYTFSGAVPATINTFGAPFAVNANQVAVVDTTAMGQADEMLADLTGGIFNSVHARLSGASGSGSNGSSALGLGGSSRMALGARTNLSSDGALPDAGSTDRSSGVWGQALGGHRDEEATSTSAQASHSYFGGIAGLDGWISRSVQIGAFTGGATADLKVPLSQNIDVETFFGGAYANFTNGKSFLRLLLTAGTSDHESTRRVANNTVASGLQTAIASFDGNFISPEVAVGTTWNLGRLTIEHSARLRYAHLSLDSYTETGAAGNFTVGDRDVSLWLGRAQLAFPVTSAIGTLSPRVGIEVWGADHDTVSGVLIGQAVAFTPVGGDDDVTGLVGVTATTTFGSATAVVDSEIHLGEDGYTRAAAHAGIRIPF